MTGKGLQLHHLLCPQWHEEQSAKRVWAIFRFDRNPNHWHEQQSVARWKLTPNSRQGAYTGAFGDYLKPSHVSHHLLQGLFGYQPHPPARGVISIGLVHEGSSGP